MSELKAKGIGGRTRVNHRAPVIVTRRQVVVGCASVGALSLIGCGESELDGGGSGYEGGYVAMGQAGEPALVTVPDTAPIMPGTLDEAQLDPAVFPDLGEPEISSSLWQMMTPLARASADGSYGTRLNLHNPATVPQRIVIQAFLPNGQLVMRYTLAEAFQAGTSQHIELHELLPQQGVPLPFEGNVWIGATPQGGNLAFMGLQAITVDWWGPAHMASVHTMRDFGNSNHDAIWSDLILPRVHSGPRYSTKVAVLNASGDGRSAAYLAQPELTIRDDAGGILYQAPVGDIPPFSSRVLDVRTLLDGADLESGSMQVTEPVAGLVVYGFVFDHETGSIANADHFFDRHFVVSLDATELFD